MSLGLAVRIGDRHVTREVAGLAFRKEAIGGVQAISLRLYRPLVQIGGDATHLTKVYVYNQAAETIAEGRISDTGRTASGDGQTWDLTCFGPAQHASDRRFPYIVVDTGLEGFRRSTYSVKNATTGTDERGEDTPTLMISAEEGKTVAFATWQGDIIYRGLKSTGQKLARFRADIDSGVVAANYKQRLTTRQDAGAATTAASASADTTASTLAGVVVTDFPNGDNVASVHVDRITSDTTGAETHWFEFWDVAIRAMLKDSAGTDITSGYTVSTVLAHEVVNDLLGRVLTQYDGATATVDDTTAYTIDQLAYPDSVSAAEVLDDLMVLEPTHRWTTGPDTTGNGYTFSWEPWPTTVRYEATLDDGGDFPAPTQDVFNEAVVRWTDKKGRPRTTTVTLACALLDDAGVTRTAELDLGDNIGSTAAATRAGDNYLAEHNVPPNAGTLNIARPIRDLETGRMVQPYEIEPGELIRVRGIESYADALNASSSDGQTVFRIWAMNYTSEGNTAQLELDTYPRTTAAALARLTKRKRRRR